MSGARLEGANAELIARLRDEENWPFTNDRTKALLNQAADTLEREQNMIYTKEDAEELCRLAIDGYKRAQKFIK